MNGLAERTGREIELLASDKYNGNPSKFIVNGRVSVLDGCFQGSTFETYEYYVDRTQTLLYGN